MGDAVIDLFVLGLVEIGAVQVESIGQGIGRDGGISS